MNKFRYFMKAVALSIKIKRPISIIINIVGFAAAFLPMLISLRLKSFSDNVQSLFSNPEMLRTTITSFVLLAAFFIFQIVFNLIARYMAAEDTARIKRYIKEQMIILLTTVPFSYIENNRKFKEKVDFVRSYAGQQAAGSVTLVLSWIANLISFVSILLILSLVSPWIVIILIATCIPAVILSYLQKEETYINRTWDIKELKMAVYYADMCRWQRMIKDVRFFGLYPHLKNKVQFYKNLFINRKNKIIRKHLIFNSIADLLRNGVYFFVVLITAIEIYNNPGKGIGTFMLVISAAGQLQNITTGLLVNAVNIFSDSKYIEDFFKLFETEKEVASEDEKDLKEMLIEFKNVDFSYPGTDSLALDDLNVTIRQGEKIAVVGANGSGKSTFINLLCGLYFPQNGSVNINGQDIKENLCEVRRSLSVIFQSFCQYSETLRNNIAISDPKRSNEDDELMALAKQTGADEVIEGKENGLDEVIGLFSETGVNLSGGQWQKIAITRALFRKNASVFILDEPTASLDPIAEANIYRNFNSLTGDKTTILISHRLGVTSVVDRILVFDKGKIVEDGKHDDLIAQRGIYFKMYKAQARWYK